MTDQKPLFEKQWNRYGMSGSEWDALQPEERVVHYNRNLSGRCEHKANLSDWPVDLRDSYSHDTYFHTAHMETCQKPKVQMKDCPCQMCRGRIGTGR
jgi:hypothetical protein